MIELELELAAIEPVHAANLSRAKIDILHVSLDDVDMAQNATDRVYDIARRKIAGRDFVQHRREENEILPRDQGYFDILPSRQMLVQIFRRIKSGESTAGNHNLCFLHGNRIARRSAVVKDSVSFLSIGREHAVICARQRARAEAPTARCE